MWMVDLDGGVWCYSECGNVWYVREPEIWKKSWDRVSIWREADDVSKAWDCTGFAAYLMRKHSQNQSQSSKMSPTCLQLALSLFSHWEFLNISIHTNVLKSFSRQLTHCSAKALQGELIVWIVTPHSIANHYLFVNNKLVCIITTFPFFFNVFFCKMGYWLWEISVETAAERGVPTLPMSGYRHGRLIQQPEVNADRQCIENERMECE